MAAASVREQLVARAAEVRELLGAASITRPRLFGSTSHGKDGPDSDVDLLVDAGPNCTLLDLCQVEEELEALFGRPFDLVTAASLHPRILAQAVAEGIPL